MSMSPCRQGRRRKGASHMDAEPFDALVRSLACSFSRRVLLGGLPSGPLVFLASGEALAAKRRKRKKKKRSCGACGPCKQCAGGRCVNKANGTDCEANRTCQEGQCRC